MDAAQSSLGEGKLLIAYSDHSGGDAANLLI